MMTDCGLEDNTDEGEFPEDVCPPFNLKPQDGAVCSILLTSSKLVNVKYPLDKVVEFNVGDNDSVIDESISELLVNMKAGEVGTIEVPPGDNDTSEQTKEDIALDCGTLSITLCSFKNSQPIHQLTYEQKFNCATKYKAKGVELFKAQKVKYSFMQFSKALKYLISMLPVDELSESFQAEYKSLRVQCYSNIAACQLSQGSYNFVVSNCTKALAIEPINVKCLYRRAEANFQLGKYDLCSNDVKEGLKCEPKSKSFQVLLRKVTNQAK